MEDWRLILHYIKNAYLSFAYILIIIIIIILRLYIYFSFSNKMFLLLMLSFLKSNNIFCQIYLQTLSILLLENIFIYAPFDHKFQLPQPTFSEKPFSDKFIERILLMTNVDASRRCL